MLGRLRETIGFGMKTIKDRLQPDTIHSSQAKSGAVDTQGTRKVTVHGGVHTHGRYAPSGLSRRTQSLTAKRVPPQLPGARLEQREREALALLRTGS